ncbi:MAG: hypothetical protein AAGC55_31295, partial [Myxococcota bacterium]
MSKEADKEAVESTSSQRSRRRRKKSGLRIPSDNVPRTTPTTPITPIPAAASSGQWSPDEHSSERAPSEPIIDEAAVRVVAPAPVHHHAGDLSQAQHGSAPFATASGGVGESPEGGSMPPEAFADV